jgi:hypothetical protein
MRDTTIDEIADGVFRISTFVPDVAPPAGFVFKQFLVRDEEPLLFHCGQRMLFPKVSEAVYIDTPHVPHGWEAGIFYEETAKTLFCGDLFTHVGEGSALVLSVFFGPGSFYVYLFEVK